MTPKQTQQTKDDNFTKTLAILGELCANGNVYFSMSPPIEIGFLIDKDLLREKLKVAELSEGDFRRESNIIGDQLRVIFNETEAAYVEYTVERRGLKGEDAERTKGELLKQVEGVRGTLYTQHLHDRYVFKTNSKAPSFTGVDWDIKIKVEDAQLDHIEFPYATCKVTYQRQFDVSPFTLIGGKVYDSVQINFCVDDIEHMINVFSKIRDHLKRVHEQVKGDAEE